MASAGVCVAAVSGRADFKDCQVPTVMSRTDGAHEACHWMQAPIDTMSAAEIQRPPTGGRL